MKQITYRNITLKEMLEDLVKWQLDEGCQYDAFYYLNGDGNFKEITEVDMCDSRFKTEDGDFSEYDWELENSNIYVREEIN